jgi:hypothetical protein
MRARSVRAEKRHVDLPALSGTLARALAERP